MRLINTETFELKEFFDDEIIPYAILSHTWGQKELTFEDCRGPSGLKYRGGSPKIDGCCQQARKDNHQWVWIDSICIDKSSSAELTESINSMYNWYRESQVCYIYLVDVPSDEDCLSDDSAFRRSRWFSRGWTLQELLAPDNNVFFSEDWTVLLSRTSTRYHAGISCLESITTIPSFILSSAPDVKLHYMDRIAVAKKLSWASHRNTKRKEDRAYSLLGLFNVNTPMLYGEGEKAFIRLQEEITKVKDDESLFVWGYGISPTTCRINGMFAPSPDYYAQCEHLTTRNKPRSTHYTITNRGVYMDMKLSKRFDFSQTVFGELAVDESPIPFGVTIERTMAIPLDRRDWNHHSDSSSEIDSIYVRPAGAVPVFVHAALFDDVSYTRIYIGKDYDNQTEFQPNFQVDLGQPLFGSVEEVYPPAYHSIFQGNIVHSHWLSQTSSTPDMIFTVRKSTVPEFAVKFELAIEEEWTSFLGWHCFLVVKNIFLAKNCWPHPSLAAALMGSNYSIPWEGVKLDWTDEGKSVTAFIAENETQYSTTKTVTFSPTDYSTSIAWRRSHMQSPQLEVD